MSKILSAKGDKGLQVSIRVLGNDAFDLIASRRLILLHDIGSSFGQKLAGKLISMAMDALDGFFRWYTTILSLS